MCLPSCETSATLPPSPCAMKTGGFSVPAFNNRNGFSGHELDCSNVAGRVSPSARGMLPDFLFSADVHGFSGSRFMCKFPIILSSLRIKGSWFQCAGFDSSHRNHFRIISGCKNLIRGNKVVIRQSFFDHLHLAITQETDHPSPSNTRQKSAIRDGRKNYSVLGHE